MHQSPKCISQARGLNAQAKGEVPFSRKDGAVELHKQKGKYRHLSAGGVEQYKQKEKYLWEGGNRNSFFWQLHGEAGTWWYQGVVRTSGADLGLEQSVVVLRMVRRWPAFDPLFFSGGGEAQFRDQDNCVVLIAPNKSALAFHLCPLQENTPSHVCPSKTPSNQLSKEPLSFHFTWSQVC